MVLPAEADCDEATSRNSDRESIIFGGVNYGDIQCMESIIENLDGIPKVYFHDNFSYST